MTVENALSAAALAHLFDESPVGEAIRLRLQSGQVLPMGATNMTTESAS
jgi:hypothetical protein